jgi:hypothetical protein
MSFDAGEALIEKISSFDSFVQIIEDEAEIVIEGNTKCLWLVKVLLYLHTGQI